MPRPKYNWPALEPLLLDWVAQYGCKWSDFCHQVGHDPPLQPNTIEAHWRRHLAPTVAGRKALAAFEEAKIPDDWEPPSVSVSLPTLEADHPDLRHLERRLQDAALEIRDLKKKLKEADTDRSLWDYLSQEIQTHTPPAERAEPACLPHAPESAVPCDLLAVLSDEHADEIVQGEATWGLEIYNYEVFRCRLARWAELVVGYARDYLPLHAPERIWVAKLGDAVHGDIHGHGDRNAFGNTLKAALAVGDAEWEAIEWIHLQTGLPVHVVSVSGNHPRRSARKDYEGPHSNFDYLVATQIATRATHYRRDGTISVHAPDAWTAFLDVRGKVVALNHGDDVRGYAGFPWYGFSRNHNRVQAVVARTNTRIDYWLHGHYHTEASATENQAHSIHSGSFTLTDPYALNAVGGASEPQQPLLVIGNKGGQRGRLLTVPLWVRDEDLEDQLRAGVYDPPFGARTIIDDLATDTPPNTLPIIVAK